MFSRRSPTSLGLDTHDPCDRTVYEPGMVITCEPGLYVAEEGIGIRLENEAKHGFLPGLAVGHMVRGVEQAAVQQAGLMDMGSVPMCRAELAEEERSALHGEMGAYLRRFHQIEGPASCSIRFCRSARSWSASASFMMGVPPFIRPAGEGLQAVQFRQQALDMWCTVVIGGPVPVLFKGGVGLQKGVEQAVQAAGLLAEYEDCAGQLEDLMARINRTNCETKTDRGTLTELLARRDCLKMRVETYRNFLTSASSLTHRATRSEIRITVALSYRRSASCAIRFCRSARSWSASASFMVCSPSFVWFLL